MARYVFIFLLCFFPIITVAQTIPLLDNAPELQVTPSTPNPEEVVTVQVTNIFGTLGETSFTWRVDGQIVDQGVGRNSIATKVGVAGSVTTVSVSTFVNGSSVGEKTIEIRPASVDIIWEGDTYTPPFYIGRPLPNGSGSITALAVPYIVDAGSLVSADDLVYAWYINNGTTPKKSGYGLKSITIPVPQFENEFTLSVMVSTRDGKIQTQGIATIKPVRPVVMVYQRAPLLGVLFNKAITGDVHFSDQEVTFDVFPLFVSSPQESTYNWSVNNKKIDGTEMGGRRVTFRRAGEGGGSYPIQFSFKNKDALFENGTYNFRLTF